MEYVKKRVAAYARVSTDSEEQLSSYEAQVDFYTRHIQSNHEWEFVEVYTDEGIPTPAGKIKWSVSTVLSILQNEKYKGDAILQKTFTVDFLTKTTKVNEGEIPQYYVENSHPVFFESIFCRKLQVENTESCIIGFP